MSNMRSSSRRNWKYRSFSATLVKGLSNGNVRQGSEPAMKPLTSVRAASSIAALANRQDANVTEMKHYSVAPNVRSQWSREVQTDPQPTEIE
jgi:hypothetical protein